MARHKKSICKILTVDDELAADTFFNKFFEMNNYEVITAGDGESAIKMVKKDRPKVVLLDVKMPGMDGLAALKEIKSINKDIVVIMVTALADDQTMKMAMELGADDYVTKPLSIEDLEKKIVAMVSKDKKKD